jgi:Domain of unknown function (DUF6894)
MPRYYFNIASKGETFPDSEGVDLTDDVAAHEHALRLITKIMLYDPEEWDWRGWRVDVVDGRQSLVVTVLYPCSRPGPRRTFGKRRHKFHYLPGFLWIAGAAVFFSTSTSQAAAQNSISCIHSGRSVTCVASSGYPNGIAKILRIEASDQPGDEANRAEREQKWIARCHPVRRPDKYGMTRYHYSAPGCEFGATED